MLLVEEYDRLYYMDKGFLLYRDYVMDVVVFTEDKIYFSESIFIKIFEGGKFKGVFIF